MGFAARVGAAFHRTLQSLSENPPKWSSPQDTAEVARARFMGELEVQEAQRASRPREAQLPRDESRISRATEAIMGEALRVVPGLPLEPGSLATGELPSQSLPVRDEAAPITEHVLEVEVEVHVQSRDGLLHGRVDRAERAEDGTRLVDYKSAIRDDLPDRYERQLQLYGVLWHETRGEWPVGAQVIYPFMSSSHKVDMTPDVCERVYQEARRLIMRTQQSPTADQLATPGDVCKACDFRPWCKPFWQWQAAEPLYMHAITNAVQGFEGVLERIDQVSAQWRLHVRWRGNLVRIVAPLDRFPQLHQARVGSRIRVLDMRLHGNPFQPQAIVTEYSELFLLV